MKNKKNKVLLIDGHNILHRAYHQYSSMRNEDGKVSSMVFGFPYILGALLNLHRPNLVYVVFDGSKDKRRLEILPGYKDRVKKDDFDFENFKEQKEVVKKMVTDLGVDIIHNRKREADDLIYLITRKESRKSQVVIVSTDKDFDQLINKNVSIWNPFKKERITHLNCFKLKGYHPEQCVDYLSLLGDTSDCIPGYKGVGDKTALKFLNEFGSIENFINSKNEFSRINRQQLVDLYKVNKELIDIKYFVKKNSIKLTQDDLIKGKFNQKEVKLACADYGITKIQKPEFLIKFKQLYDSKRV